MLIISGSLLFDIEIWLRNLKLKGERPLPTEDQLNVDNGVCYYNASVQENVIQFIKTVSNADFQEFICWVQQGTSWLYYPNKFHLAGR